MTITQHKADELFTKLVEAQAPVRPERLAEIQVAAEAGWELASDYIHLARAWLGSQQALRDVIAENAALRARVEELEAQLEIMDGRAIVAENEVFRLTRYVPPVTSNESDTQYITYSDNRTYDGEGTA